MSVMTEALARIDAYENSQRPPGSRDEVERDLSFFQYQVWFPSLTNMMLAIAESLETVGTFLPGFMPAQGGLEPEQERQQWETVRAIAKKYGSPSGRIVAN